MNGKITNIFSCVLLLIFFSACSISSDGDLLDTAKGVGDKTGTNSTATGTGTGTGTSVPGTPSGVTITASSGQTIISWNAVSGATSYNIYWATFSGVSAFSTKITGASSPYTHTGRTNGTSYYYKVAAVNANGEGGLSTEVSATPQATLPGTPTSVSVTGGDAQTTITWTGVNGAISYNIYWNTTGSVSTASTKITGATSPYTHIGRTNGTKYYYKVSAVDANGESGLSTEVSATPQVAVPGAPTGVTVTASSGQTIISWTAVTGATSYNIYWATAAGVTTSSTKITGAVSPYSHTGRTNGTTYYYKLVAVNAGGESVLSTEMSATPLAVPGTPTGVSVTGGDAQTTITWTAVTGATSYNIYWATATGVSTLSTKITGAASPYTHLSLSNGIPYYYKVSAVNAGGESALSTEVSATPQAPVAPGAPTGVTITAVDGEIIISWETVSGATSYNIYWNTTGSVTTSDTKITGATSPYSQTGRTNGIKYYYKISAVNAGGESVLSSEVWGTPSVNPVGDKVAFTVSSVGFSMVIVSGKRMKTNTDDSGTATVSNPFWMGETEVTYELWSAVYTWATANGYNFANAGTMGDGAGDTNQHPVTTINWRDAMVWTNALTGYYNAMNATSYSYVYKAGGLPIKDSRDSNGGICDAVIPDSSATGFRLPTMNEWELAARYKADSNSDGDISDAGEYYPGNYASGGTADYTNTTTTVAVAWYWDNSGSSTHPVKGKLANALGLYDMSGNVWEWNFDWYPSYVGTGRVIRGGAYGYTASYQRVGYVFDLGYVSPFGETADIGFRFARTQ